MKTGLRADYYKNLEIVRRWKSVAVYHSEPVPDGARPLAAEGPIIGIAGAPLVVGVFSDGPAPYIMFVNRDYEKPRTAVIRFASGMREALEIAKNDRPPVRLAWSADQSERVCVLEFAAGNARIFRLK
jgi:hypothetical protein